MGPFEMRLVRPGECDCSPSRRVVGPFIRLVYAGGFIRARQMEIGEET